MKKFINNGGEKVLRVSKVPRVPRVPKVPRVHKNARKNMKLLARFHIKRGCERKNCN